MYRYSKRRRLDRRCCRCPSSKLAYNKDFSVRDFPFLYTKIMTLELDKDQKETILMRFTNIMDKVKHKYGIFFFFHSCTKSFLIIGNILIPSILSIEAMFYDNKEVRLIVFWGVWGLSLSNASLQVYLRFFNKQYVFHLFPITLLQLKQRTGIIIL